MAAVQWLKANGKPVLRALVALLVLVVLYLFWARFQPARSMTLESQQLATSPAGVQLAANFAQVPLTESQTAAVVQAIKAAPKERPAAKVATTGANLKATIQTELKKSGGQFAIVTDPVHPTAAPVVPPAATVTLNQYNIKAYPDRLIQIGGSSREVFAAYNWRVSVPKIPLLAPHGAVGYLGAYTHINFDRSVKSRVGVLLTIPR